MSKYFQAKQHGAATTVFRRTISTEVLPPQATEEDADADPIIAIAAVDRIDMPGDLARDPALWRLSEQLAALGGGGNPVRLLVTGCRPGDGASTLAVALAIDLSQRLALHTVLVDGHIRHPALRNILSYSGPTPVNLNSAASLSAQRTAWPRLELISRAPVPAEHSKPMLDDLNGLLGRYSVAVIDLGVIRLEPRMLALARDSDPILIVTRYQHTERQDLLTTAGVLRGSNHTVSGVILNGYKSPVPGFIRRWLGFGG